MRSGTRSRKPRVQVAGLELLPPAARKPGLFAAVCRKAIGLERARVAGEINVVFLERKRMLEMNQRFLKHNHDTDVIAFNYDEAGPDAPFGDIYISAHQAKIQAAELGHPLLKEALTLVAHGTLHLLGYDDSTPRKKAAMFRRQDEILSAIRSPRER